MSCDPIFGLIDLTTGDYTAVAMQNSWHPPTRTLFGCPLRVIGAILTTYLAARNKTA
ncbi:hypothetical protein [Frigoriglobus tundricola]|uniref:Uncharacterized protein n=1 Tax=Frigoriglobus tundricola TaxID=2774151 RepID=A0A6M5YJQ4_9BACT|nr:hypothetical protein [Frigoriglobus tundricola]QJW93212.1 hypothetical protein FTUN_0717 [Frigoriglobus tundricola]